MVSAYDELWRGGPRFLSDAGAVRVTTDSVLLGAFAARIRAKTILDLGCGSGVLAVLLGLSHPGAAVEAVDIQPEAAARAAAAMELNGLSPAGVRCGDLRNHRALFAAGRFDLVVCNPPYFPVGSGASAPDPARAAARDERCCTLEDVCAAAGYLTRWGGAFALVHRPDRLSELCCALTRHGLEPKRLRFVHPRPGSAPNLLLLEARRGGKPGLDIEKPLLLTDADGGESAEVREIYHRK